MSDRYDARRNHRSLPPNSLPSPARISSYSSIAPALGYQPSVHIVPQEPYGPTLAEVVYSIQGSHTPGIALASAPANVHGLWGKEQPFFAEMGMKASIRVNWPGYEPYSHQFTIKDARINANPISIARSVQLIADEMRRAINKLEGRPCTQPAWRVGRGFIEMEHLILIKVSRVSNGSVQPHFAVRRR